MPGISDDAKRNREDWTQANAAYTDARASRTGPRTRSRGASSACPSRRSAPSVTSRPRCRRARLRHGVRLGLACEARRPPRRRRRDAGPARDRPPLPGRVRARVPARRGERGGRPASVARASTSPSRSTARASGATLTSGYPRRFGSCALAVGCGSSETARSRSSAPPTKASRPSAAAAPAGDGAARVAGRARRRVAAPSRRALRRAAAHGLRDHRPLELYPPDDAVDHAYYDTFSAEWARKWPVEEIWVAKKPG